jgi:hypothetical protein
VVDVVLFAICYTVIILLFSLLKIRNITNLAELNIIGLRISRLPYIVVLESSCTPSGCKHLFPATPPIATSGETSSTSQVLLKGTIVRVCWCVVRAKPWVCPFSNIFSESFPIRIQT